MEDFSMKRYRIIKRLEAKNIKEALKNESKAEVVEVWEDSSDPEAPVIKPKPIDTGFKK